MSSSVHSRPPRPSERREDTSIAAKSLGSETNAVRDEGRALLFEDAVELALSSMSASAASGT
jgi:hypothetical protein